MCLNQNRKMARENAVKVLCVLIVTLSLFRVSLTLDQGKIAENVSLSLDRDFEIVSVDSDRVVSQLNHSEGIPAQYSWLVGLYDHRSWSKQQLYDGVASNCSKHMNVYLEALRLEKEWAIKMFDASGRYNGQFFFGNDFWLGSSLMCYEMEQERIWSNDRDKTPPFSIEFNVARMHLNIANLTTQLRIMLIGECLPRSCSAEDVLSILRNSSEMNSPRGSSESVNLDILLVKKIPGSYDMWKDVKFFIVGGVGLSVIFLMIVASAYESYVNSHNREKDESERNGDIEIECQNNNYTHSGNGTVNGNGNIQRNGSSQNLNDNGAPAALDSMDTCEKVAKSDRKKIGTGIFSQILLSFSIISNTEKIMRTEDSTEDSISCIHGLRFLSLAWVIMVHTYLQLFTVADNKTLRIITERNFFYQTVGNASYSVDTFFFISGFLITYLYFKSNDAKKNAIISRKKRQNADQQLQDKSQYAFTNPSAPQQTLATSQQLSTDQPIATQFTRRTCSRDIKSGLSEFGKLMFYRVVRLTPAYLFVIGINQLSIRHMDNNSVFELNIYDHINCDKYWWRNVLYINNFFPQSEMCMLWSWYMANDTQFYVLGAMLILLSKRYFKASSIILIALMISSWLTTGYISIINDYKAKIQEPFEMFDQLYDKPWSRLGPYLIGMITGWYVYKCRGKVTIPWWLNLISWPCALGIVSSLIYGMKDGYLDQWPTAFYISIGHTAWGVSVAWIVLYCISSKDGILNKLLSYRGILPLSRLAYCAYLVHPTIMVICSYQLDGPFHLHNGIVLVIYAGNAVMSYLMSYAISVAFEAPVVRLLKISKKRN